MESKAGRGVGWVLPFSLVCVGLALLAGPELPWPSYHPSPPRSPEQWRQERTNLSSGLQDLRVQFYNQTRPACTLVAASLKAPMQPLPDYPAAMSAKMSQDAKKDEFRKYLEKAGVLELLTKSLVQLYEVSGSRCEQCNFSLIFAVFRSPRSRVTLCLTSRIRAVALPMTKSASRN